MFKVAGICEELDYTELFNTYLRSWRKVNPITMFEIIVFGYMEHWYSGRDIAKACKTDIRFMWLLNGEPAPNHVTISRFQDNADEVCVYAKLPRGFHIPTPVGNYTPDWAIAFYEGTVKHIYFIAETKGTMESLSLKPIEKAKISCARRLFNEISTENVKYHDVDSYQSLLNIINSMA